MKELQFSVDIQATPDKVWQTLWQDETFRQWASLIDPQTYMVGELIEGNQVQFISEANGYGVTSLVEKVEPNMMLILRHQADTQDSGAQERDKQWTGGQEAYSLTQYGDTTTLTITFGVPPELEEHFSTAYPKALQLLKELAEN